MRSIVQGKKPNWRQDSAFSEKVEDFDISIGSPRQHATALKLVLGAIAFWVCVFLSFGWIFDHISPDALRPSLGFYPSRPLPLAASNDPAALATSKEAYVLFLPSVQREEYLLALRVLLYGYKHDEDTRDTRDVVVMTTPQVPLAVEDQLRTEGAIIFRHDLITSIPNPHDPKGDHRWKDQYNKLLIWNMTQYERVLLTDSDMLMAKSLKDIWEEPFARPAHGLTAAYQGEEADDYPNTGFIIATPNRTMFEELLLVRDFEIRWGGDIEQGLVNKYFRRTGPHPWTPLHKDNIWVKNGPKKEDLARGVHMLHEKCWMDGWDRELTSLWRMKLGKMNGYWAARREMLAAGDFSHV